MSRKFFMSDPHLQHEKLFAQRGFASVKEHDKTIIDNILKTVAKEDTLYILGDLCVGGDMTEETKAYFASIPCRVIVSLGNHDSWEKTKFFFSLGWKIVGDSEVKGDLVISHMPVHPNQLKRYKACIHGHMHEDIVMDSWYDVDRNGGIMEMPFEDRRYVNVSMEQINYTPISYDEIKERLMEAGIL